MISPKKLFQKTKTFLKNHKKQTIIGGIGVLLVVGYGVLFVVPRSVDYSYAGDNCINQLAFLPDIQRSVVDGGYDVSYQSGLKIGNATLVSSKTCFTPNTAPTEGETMMVTAPWGGLVARSHFRLQVPAAPVASVEPFSSPVPTTRPIELPLSQPDEIFNYDLAIDEEVTECDASDAALICDITPLKLQQGVEYEATLSRYFDEEDRKDLHTATLETLSPIKIIAASVVSQQTIYDQPSSFTVEVDKLLESAEFVLQQEQKEDSYVDVLTTLAIEDKILTISFDEPLPRDSGFSLRLEQLTAQDGSTLAEPQVINFRTSDGPKLARASVGATKAPTSGSVTLTFDQALSPEQDVAKLVAVEGASAVVSRGESSITVSYSGLGRCAPLVVTIKPGLLSQHDVKQEDSIVFRTRSICQSVETIGYSHGGRAINSFSFGNGDKTILFTGAIHGNEKSSYYTLQSWINELEARATEIPQGVRVVVAPMLNPDGFYVHGRDNARSVNLNRNFPTANWQKDIVISGGRVDEGGGGESAGSELETKVLMALTARLNPHITITYHSSGSLVNSNSHSRAATLGAQYARQAGYWFVPDSATEATFGFAMTGTYEDWMAETGRPAFLIELPTDHGDYLRQHRAAMWAAIRS